MQVSKLSPALFIMTFTSKVVSVVVLAAAMLAGTPSVASARELQGTSAESALFNVCCKFALPRAHCRTLSSDFCIGCFF